jgi:hypothetical protein
VATTHSGTDSTHGRFKATAIAGGPLQFREGEGGQVIGPPLKNQVSKALVP